MSSIDSLLIGGSTIIYKSIFKKDQIESKKKMFFARLITTIFGIG
jgi:Na+/pantothenate symporter